MKTAVTEIEVKGYLSLDWFRGLAVSLMPLYNLVPSFSRNAPLVLQHGRERMPLFGDLIAPFFSYIMGASPGISVLGRRIKDRGGEQEIFRQGAKRPLYLVLIGLVHDVLVFGAVFTWGILEALG